MTIFGTPGGTPLNAPPFQGTTPGNAVGATLQLAQPGVGMFPPNSNTNSGDSILAAQSRGAVPANVINTMGLVGKIPRPLLETEGRGETSGTAINPGLGGIDTMNISANGGSGLGAGGANQDTGQNAGISSQVAVSVPAAALAVASPPNYGG